MKKQHGISELGFIGLCVIGLVVLFAICFCVDQASCQSRWDGSGLKTTYGPIQGCKVQLPDGRWLPEDRVREIDIKATP